jgi:formylmethanofuran dehydrogenase subunit A
MKIEADMQMAREKMEFEASEADKQRQVDLAKAIMSEFNGPEVNMTSPEDALSRASEIMARINEVISATRDVGGMPLEETTVMVMDDDDDFIEPVLQ